ncbi:MAG: dihydrofolate reductase [Gammaproteobacteria bacterium]|nr:dihydrofolate reductase [Gammaproteobacteria bacterium]
MTLSLIYARSNNHCIGAQGKIPWHLPNDFAHFKHTTMGKPIIMGRKTYEDHQSALPGRLNVVVSRQKDYAVAPGIVLAHSLDEALRIARDNNPSVFVIGGVTFFIEALPQADVVYETVVDIEIEGDAILPAFDFSDWHTEVLHEHGTDDRHAVGFVVYKHSRAT